MPVKKIKDFFWIAVGMACIGLFFSKMIKRYRTDHIDKADIIYIKAIIIDDKNYEPNQPVSAHFSYLFKINGKKYVGNAQDGTLNIGDTVEVECNKGNPDLNKPLHPKE
jgi:hypothetical protein